jgi:hypothetical protein
VHGYGDWEEKERKVRDWARLGCMFILESLKSHCDPTLAHTTPPPQTKQHGHGRPAAKHERKHDSYDSYGWEEVR